MCSETKFKFDSPVGWELCCQILKERLPFGPHDYQLEGVAAILDKRDFIGVSATGSGKSCSFCCGLPMITMFCRGFHRKSSQVLP